MKKNLLLTIMIIVVATMTIHGQTVVMSNGSGTCSCQGLFFDPGGESDYQSNADITYVLSPSNIENLVELVFQDFDVEKLNDYLLIYDGNSSSAPLIGRFNNANPPKEPVHASFTNPSGSLTLVFHSENATTPFRGWKATISCVTRQSEVISANSAHYFFKITGLQSQDDAIQLDKVMKTKNGILKCETKIESGVMSIEAEPSISSEVLRETIMSTWKITGKVISAERIVNNTNQ